MTPPAPATGASPARAATRAAARTALMRCSAGRDACIATHPSDFCVPLVALDAVVEIEGPDGRREVRAGRVPSAARHDARARDRACGGRADRRAAPAARGGRLPRPCPLSETARAHVVRLRARLGRRGAGDRGRRHQGGPPRARRRRRQALARPRGGGAARRAPPRRGRLCAGRPRPRSPTPGLPATTPSRSNSRNGS